MFISLIKLLLTSLVIITPFKDYVNASQLVECKNSTQFQQRMENSLKRLESKLVQYSKDTPAYVSLNQQIDKTKARFENYKKSNLSCGKDGLPHLITDGSLNHAGEFLIPAIIFLYITGWIGWAGRGYLIYSKNSPKSNENEIIIDTPIALKYMLSGFFWPILAIREYKSGELLANKNEITVSPR
uniref:Photosystem I reaction center subunit III n=1 Tax=Cyanidium sp. THAL103 TaxID=3027999 RepID=A0A9Y1I4A5_9RHOD|nr:photosystem I subunit III [Cyanidium sp. THAL103]